MLPKFDLLDNFLQNDSLSWQQVYEFRETVQHFILKCLRKPQIMSAFT